MRIRTVISIGVIYLAVAAAVPNTARGTVNPPAYGCYTGIFRGSSGLWALRGVTRTYYGTDGDIPVTR
ncbi:MAG: hypothetical protein RAO92_02410 [Candidatus Euphemobacter frigidus]|nr:hypothetical protein [Candidatus Euphemobacter frigidus]MDP8275236.1 hypothetical protein [Candidatus Euphemobacter frigidus]